ncbi:hypothetical protein IQ06DRAFT_347613 [Phaeosphaeriaceae sp. SRC1lsM3a]|nr:hypothetical protein IQ06DRAFT_347613 [Stagonospora sp. SRC1lsM3a]
MQCNAVFMHTDTIPSSADPPLSPNASGSLPPILGDEDWGDSLGEPGRQGNIDPAVRTSEEDFPGPMLGPEASVPPGRRELMTRSPGNGFPAPTIQKDDRVQPHTGVVGSQAKAVPKEAGPSRPVAHDQESRETEDQDEENEVVQPSKVRQNLQAAERSHSKLVIKGSRKKLQKQNPLPSQVRDRKDQEWVLVSESSGLSPDTIQHFQQQAHLLARAGSNWQEFARLVARLDRFDGAYCVQCNVIGHARHKCDLDDKNTACSKCVRSGRACGKLIEIAHQSYLAWLSLPDARQGEHSWEDLPYYVEHEVVEDEPPRKKRG